ncbi:COQ6 [Bugula neritina]|uniref:Ubiquinone biosynthesis monooxygenase COQ6, mitochondrial n=1 Tax=Bugula neritina TaxID=10212 RepID=A0A7J7J641_BUGNE|nr:COQ6 [Bugula neritina]
MPFKRWITYRSLSSQSYDIVISGGGMVGTAVAAALGNSPLLKNKKLLLLEAAPRKEYAKSSTFSNRVSALSPASRDFLKGIGAWKLIEDSGRFKAVNKMYVWDACSGSDIQFTQTEESDDHLAYLVENDLSVHSLSTLLSQQADRVEVAYGTTVTQYGTDNITSPSQPMKISLSSGQTISARLVIGADGFNSLARRSMGIKTTSWNYDQVGVVATLKLDKQEDGNVTAWQRFLPTGPIAVLPLSDDTSSLVWSTTPSHAKHLLALSPEMFVDELNHALIDNSKMDGMVSIVEDQYKKLLEKFGSFATSHEDQRTQPLPPTVLDIDKESRAKFPYGMMHADKYVAPRLALVGDACHRVHPLAGQGVNLGFGDAECLVRTIVNAVSLGADIGSSEHLVEYETERQRHVVATTAGIDGLYRLYSNNWTPVVLARSLGLMTVNALTPLKRLFMQHAQT